MGEVDQNIIDMGYAALAIEREKGRKESGKDIEVLLSKLAEAADFVKMKNERLREGYAEGLKNYVEEYKEVLRRRSNPWKKE